VSWLLAAIADYPFILLLAIFSPEPSFLSLALFLSQQPFDLVSEISSSDSVSSDVLSITLEALGGTFFFTFF